MSDENLELKKVTAEMKLSFRSIDAANTIASRDHHRPYINGVWIQSVFDGSDGEIPKIAIRATNGLMMWNQKKEIEFRIESLFIPSEIIADVMEMKLKRTNDDIKIQVDEENKVAAIIIFDFNTSEIPVKRFVWKIIHDTPPGFEGVIGKAFAEQRMSTKLRESLAIDADFLGLVSKAINKLKRVGSSRKRVLLLIPSDTKVPVCFESEDVYILIQTFAW